MKDLTIVTSQGNGAIDTYGRRLAYTLGALPIELDSTRSFGIHWYDPRALKLETKQFLDSRMLQELGPIHFTHHHMARHIPTLSQPCVLTVHDLFRQEDRIESRYPSYKPLISKTTSLDNMHLYRDFRGIEEADHIIAVSQYTKNQLRAWPGISDDKITVVYQGVDHLPEPKRREAAKFILFVGTEQPRKNFEGVLQAFIHIHRWYPEIYLLKVGISGGKKLREKSLRRVEELGLQDRVIFTGHVSDKNLADMYSSAICLVMPSLREGFGYPALEAMRYGCPVIVSAYPCLPETVGSAGLIVGKIGKTFTQELAQAIDSVISSKALRQDLARKGRARAKRFTWARTAKETLAVYKKLGLNLSR